MSRVAAGVIALAVLLPLAGVQATAQAAVQAAPKAPATTVRVATINTLGASHTDKPGSRWAPSAVRTQQLLQILTTRKIQVAGLQEFQPEQRVAWDGIAAGWKRWPEGTKFNTGTTSVVWRDDQWALVEGRLVDVPFYDQVRKSPYVLLQNRATGVKLWVSTFHNGSDNAGFQNQEASRIAATEQQGAVAREVDATGIPHVITGDMNERGTYFCRVAALARLSSPKQAPKAWRKNGCKPPKTRAIDWMLGTPGLSWGKYVVDTRPLVRRTTDHAVRFADITVDTAKFPAARG